MAGLTEFYCGSNEPSHASQFKWLEYTFKLVKTFKNSREEKKIKTYRWPNIGLSNGTTLEQILYGILNNKRPLKENIIY
jgi:hypothetical protein